MKIDKVRNPWINNVLLDRFGSAPFELVKVQRQLEYLTAVQKGLVAQMGGKYKSRSGFKAALDIYRYHGGLKGFYIGFPLRE